MSFNFSQFESTLTDQEHAEIKSRLETTYLAMGETEVELVKFKEYPDGNIFYPHAKDPTVMDLRPIFRAANGAEQMHFMRLPMNWKMYSPELDISVRSSFKELSNCGLDPLFLTQSIVKTKGASLTELIGLKCLINKGWSPTKCHSKKIDKLYRLVDSADNVLLDTPLEFTGDYKKLHESAQVLALQKFNIKYESQPAISIRKLLTADNSSINSKLLQIANGIKEAPKVKKLDLQNVTKPAFAKVDPSEFDIEF